MGIQIENDRLIIRSLKNKDLAGVSAMREETEIYRYEPTFLAELQGSPKEALCSIINMNLDKDRQCILGIFEKSNPSVLMGLAEFYDYKSSGKVISVGYRLMSMFWGRGIASETLGLLLQYIKNNTQVRMITAHVIPENKASSHCLLKNGFEYLVTKTEDWGHEELLVAEVYTYEF